MDISIGLILNKEHSKAIRRKELIKVPESGTEKTATPEGQEMIQVLSTFTALEQDRFDAFRRSTFKGDDIAKFVAHSLSSIEENINSRQWKMNMNQTTASSDLHGPFPLPKRELKDLVASENKINRNSCPAQEITIVVSTLAKAYAQRLVSSARKVATSSKYPENKKILSEHLREAHFQRVHMGVDPGFFMHTPQHVKVRGSSGAGGTLSICNGGFGSILSGSSVAESADYLNKRESALVSQKAFEKLHKIDSNENEHDKAMNGTKSHVVSKIPGDKDSISQNLNVESVGKDSFESSINLG